MKTVTVEEVQGFISRMDADMRRMNEEFEAECQLAEAITRYERVMNVKIKVSQENQ
jgi:hypothetical protein